MPEISVIVPVYKVEMYLHRCINSILAQTFKDFELILVDDGSPDNSGIICEKYAAMDKRIHVIHQKNSGLSAARNTGINWALTYSDSQWLSFVDSDDWIHELFLEKLYIAATRKEAGAACCLYTRVLPNGEELDNPFCEQEIEELSFDLYFSKTGMGFTPYIICTKLINKKLFTNIRFPVGKLNEDLFTTHKLLYLCSTIVRINTVMYYYYQSSQSIMRNDWKPQRLDEVEASEKLIVFMKKNRCREAEKTAFKRYLWVLESQIEQIEKQKNSSLRKYKCILLFKIRYLLIFHRKKVISSKDSDGYFQLYFPFINWLHWTCIGVLKKITRVNNRNGNH